MNKIKYIKSIVSEIKSNYRNNEKKKISELNKLLKFIKDSDYFNGNKRKLYKIIIIAKKE